jgi:hypothetical protein
MSAVILRMVLIAALLLAAPCAMSQGGRDDSLVKARVALAVARFAERDTAEAPRPLRLCLAVVGQPPKALLSLAQEKIGASAVDVKAGPPFKHCDVLYFHSSFGEWRRVLAELNRPVLTVGDVPGFLTGGGMVELVIEDDAVRFDVSLVALRTQRIRLPSQVLKLARQVRE